MIVLREQASAKINLFLHVVGKRPDGYHLLDSLVVFAGASDTLEVVPEETRITFALEGSFASALAAGKNSVVKAAEALRTHTGIKAGAALHLNKYLPVAAGLGGGSADAAAALRLLMRFWNLKLSGHELMALALELGADVPACLRSTTLYMGGIGEMIEEGPVIPSLPMVLVNPGKPLATPDVFAARHGGLSLPARHPRAFATQAACIEFLQKTRNDLEEPAIRLMPEISNVLMMLQKQKNCALVRMSGSGATCFGIFSDTAAAQAAALFIQEAYPAWWVKHTLAG